MLKKITLITFWGLLFLVLSAPAMSQENDPVTIRFSWWGNPTRDERTIQVIELFEETYPWITVQYDTMSWDDYWISMQSQGEGGNLPDVMQQDYSVLSRWASNGWLLPLDEFVDSGIIDLSNVADASLSSGEINDVLYGINMGSNSLGVLLDVDKFEELGVELPSQDWTWDDFEAICSEIYEKSGNWCIGNLEANLTFESLWLSYGETAYSEDGTSLGYTNSQRYIDYLYMILRLQDQGAVPNRIDITLIVEQPIVTGESASALVWSNQLVGIWNDAGEDRQFVFTLLPRAADGCCSSNYVKPSMFFSIGADTEYPEEAALLIDFFTNSLEANRILLAERGVPVSSVVQDDLRDYISPAQIEVFEFLRLVEQDSSPLPPPNPEMYSSIINEVFYPLMIDPVLYGEISPEEGVELFETEAIRLLSGQ